MNTVIIHTLRKRPIPEVQGQVKGQGQGQVKGQKQDTGHGQNEHHLKTLKMKSSERQICIMLLFVSFTFLVLTTPACVFILYVMFVDYEKPASSFEEYYLFYHVGQKALYTNNAINFFLYVTPGHKFRRDLIRLFCKRNRKQTAHASEASTQMSAITENWIFSDN